MPASTASYCYCWAAITSSCFQLKRNEAFRPYTDNKTYSFQLLSDNFHFPSAQKGRREFLTSHSSIFTIELTCCILLVYFYSHLQFRRGTFFTQVLHVLVVFPTREKEIQERKNNDAKKVYNNQSQIREKWGRKRGGHGERNRSFICRARNT